MPTWAAVGLGGAVGSILRYGVGVAVARTVGTPVPLATALVNLAGCLAIGLLAGLVAADAVRLGEGTRALLFAGLLGGFTTFSSFGLDTLTLMKAGTLAAAGLNVLVQVCGGLTAVFVGFALGQGLAR
jgi:CrcB protein